jgi:hypothetical protein
MAPRNINLFWAPPLVYKLEETPNVQFSSISGTLSGTELRTGRHSSLVSTVNDYGLDDQGSIPDRGRGFLF